MIERALNSIGKKRCPECKSVLSKESNVCMECSHSFVKTSTPEDGL